ncbi:MAG TPA: glycoside hydrolase family 2 TIM barrel-domain containing protein [Verrucomicrobiae bacterium]|nr:glycoside hydrolase family 2 TIM barrel-domain containing protein [Verrucomicrobiae bacterium]
MAGGVFLAILMAAMPSIAWQPASGPLKTRWSADVSPRHALQEYPRPQMTRKTWMNLNGLWEYAVTDKDAPEPVGFQGQILVPFPIQSALSGVMQPVSETQALWYRRSFDLPRSWIGRRVLLHFGAVDFQATVWVNGKKAGEHRGGYDGFGFDITDFLKPGQPNEIVVSAWDPTDAGTQPMGKQMREPHGIWYTPTTGIWQTVWLEPVSAAHIQNIEITPDIDRQIVRIHPTTTARLGSYQIEATVWDGMRKVADTEAAAGAEMVLPVRKPKLWSPESPHLYNLTVSLKIGGRVLDQVKSYFGMRKISLGKDANGFTRMLLNNKPYFEFGPLDQGFWPDGIYTAPTDEALKSDIVMTKKLGFNMARKHVKVEPDRWYYWCDKLGLLVWQDMPSGDKHISPKEPDITRSPESGAEFEKELKAMIAGRRNHPCIVMWVPFNEGWGQWDTARITKLVQDIDPSRLVDDASGWRDRGVGSVHDMHKYPGPGCPDPEPNRAVVLGEFGGLGLPVRGHTWQAEKNWGYRSYTNSTDLTEAYLKVTDPLPSLVKEKGLSAAVYTQTTDVEIEVNGLMTYDRALVKPDRKRISANNRRIIREADGH